jgi:hypothetical protein
MRQHRRRFFGRSVCVLAVFGCTFGVLGQPTAANRGGVESILNPQIESLEEELKSTNLDAALRATQEKHLEFLKSVIADHNATELLWRNVAAAMKARDQDQLADAKTKLAAHLEQDLEHWTGRALPPGMSLDAVIDLNNKYLGRTQPAARVQWVRLGLISLMVVPLAVGSFYAFARKRHL